MCLNSSFNKLLSLRYKNHLFLLLYQSKNGDGTKHSLCRRPPFLNLDTFKTREDLPRKTGTPSISSCDGTHTESWIPQRLVPSFVICRFWVEDWRHPRSVGRGPERSQVRLREDDPVLRWSGSRRRDGTLCGQFGQGRGTGVPEVPVACTGSPSLWLGLLGDTGSLRFRTQRCFGVCCRRQKCSRHGGDQW